MQKIDLSTARALLDYQSRDAAVSAALAEQQLTGAVALYNMLAQHGLAYLADEVGMGKTYVALGVVALMRRFRPDLRVLYLLPKNNVRDKWRKDYRSFIAANYRHHDGIVKGFGQQPAVPYRNCQSLPDLMQAVATDSVRDYFVCTSAFSLALENTNEKLAQALDEFSAQLPQYDNAVAALNAELATLKDNAADRLAFKERVKACWATALHGILPRFDLVVVDEAHNYRRGRDSSDRNKLLSLVLGTGTGQASRVENVLLLSATPFDCDVAELCRQLDLFGKRSALAVPPDGYWDDVHRALAPFTVRRLNALQLGGEEHTRNMYRTEHRSGPGAEIPLGIEQQLFAAVMQKKVGEALNGRHNGKFELGMLASFESYLPNDAHKPVQFDGQDDEAQPGQAGRDAADRTIVNAMVQDFQATFGRFPPHPKMDHVAHKAGEAALGHGKKQLIFVRRVASVGELKAAIEDNYNAWIGKHVATDPEVGICFEHYRDAVRERDHRRLDGGPEHGDPATFFSWFYRGENPVSRNLSPSPSNLRQTLQRSAMFDIDWSTLPGMPEPGDVDWHQLSRMPSPPSSPTPSQLFQRAQYAYLSCVAGCGTDAQQQVARQVLAHAFEPGRFVRHDGGTVHFLNELKKTGVWAKLRLTPALGALALPWNDAVFGAIASGGDVAARMVRRHLVHASLFAALCRLDHPFVDLYAMRRARDAHEAAPEKGDADERMAAAFEKLLREQAVRTGFSSFTVLRDLADQFDLILKQNFEDIDRKSATELSTYIASQLHPLSPVLGATGENAASRSAIARKFRMPGYPRVLVSTDVFQEGEDLHTFCDSVIHYGISSSPIALEQKTGRVDRIGSLSHRRMLGAGPAYRDHFIQVGFPHIAQSLEFLQVRAAARNLNDFLVSLQRVEGGRDAYDGKVDLRDGLLDEGGIVPSIPFRLESPLSIGPEWLTSTLRPDLAALPVAFAARVNHCHDLVGRVLRELTGDDVPVRQALGTSTWNLAEAMTMQLRGAQSNGQLILCASAPAVQRFDAERLRAEGPVHYLRQLQADPALRLQMPAREDAGDSGDLIANAEIYAGGAGILSDLEVTDLHGRITTRAMRTIAAPDRAMIAAMAAALHGDHGSWTVDAARGCSLDYTFRSESGRQRIDWDVHEGYVSVHAQILPPEPTAGLAARPWLLVEHTLRRNRRFDVVDFHIDARGALSVRALHPLIHLNHEELSFICHLVAANAVRLRQVLAHPEPAPVGGRTPDDDERLEPDERHIMCVIRDQLCDGSRPLEVLIRGMAGALGWKRTSARLHGLLVSAVNAASRRRIVVNRAGMVELGARSIGEYEDGFLEDQFLAALSAESGGFVERADALRAFARWMGFARTGPKIAERGAAIIRRQIRRGSLDVQGSRIRRSRV